MKKNKIEEQLKNINTILITDAGSTTSKARFFKKINDEFRYVASGEAPTTVEAPYEDVTKGIRNALKEIEEMMSVKILKINDGEGIAKIEDDNYGVDLYLSTSSAGGGLQMMVAGIVKNMSAESAERVALGAGAIVMDTISKDDKRAPHEKISRIRELRPDMILIAGGTDDGAISLVTELVDIIIAAKPKFRLGEFKLPIIYAGNKRVNEYVKEKMDDTFALTIVENIRPILDVENPEPARRAIHELFMKHVMSHAPGYDKLLKWVDAPIIPTPMGEGLMVQFLAQKYDSNVIGVGLGGATTNVYSVFDKRFVRTVSANLGMSYSIGNVLKNTGIENIIRWLPFNITELNLRNSLKNKMIRPTTIPQTMKELIIEHAVARESLRLALIQHKLLARPLKGIHRAGSFYEVFEDTNIDMLRLNIIIGTGGLLSHAPNRTQSALILIDGFQPAGITKLYVDSIFMMPHCGVLSTVYREAAINIFEKDCLVPLGICIAPVGITKEGEEIAKIKIETPNTSIEKNLLFGHISSIPLSAETMAEIEIHPRRGFDVGNGKGNSRKFTAKGGVSGIIIDSRGRPLEIPKITEESIIKNYEWCSSLDVYPQDYLYNLKGGK